MATLTQVLAQIRSHESVGAARKLGVSPYALRPEDNIGYPTSHASGAYQFQPGTWREYATESGIGAQYSEAYKAPPNVQDALAAWVVTNKGTHDWTSYSGPVDKVTRVDLDPYEMIVTGNPKGLEFNGTQFAADPSGASGGALYPNFFRDFGYKDPTLGTALSPSLGTQNNPYYATMPGNDPAFTYDFYKQFGITDATAGTPWFTSSGFSDVDNFNARNFDIGAGDISVSGDSLFGGIQSIAGAAGAIKDLFGGESSEADNKWWQNLLTNIIDLSLRGGLGLLALVLIAAGAWAFASGSAQNAAIKLASKVKA